MTFLDFLSQVGGILGLFIGFRLICFLLTFILISVFKFNFILIYIDIRGDPIIDLYFCLYIDLHIDFQIDLYNDFQIDLYNDLHKLIFKLFLV